MGDWGGRHSKKRNSRGASGGAHYLSSVHGTEVDRLNCPFYYKMGACRHGTLCSRRHNYPVVALLFCYRIYGKAAQAISWKNSIEMFTILCEGVCKIRSVDVPDNTVELRKRMCLRKRRLCNTVSTGDAWKVF